MKQQTILLILKGEEIMEQSTMNTPNLNVLDMVVTTKEASALYNIADCTFRTWIKDGLFQSSDIKKSGNTWLIKRDALESLLKSKNIFGKTFQLDGDEVHVEHLESKEKNLQIWYQNAKTKAILDQVPHKELIPQMFKVFKEDTKMNFKFVIIDDNVEDNDNWFFRKEKVWALTAKAIIETLHESLIKKEGFDLTEFESFRKKMNI